MRFRLKREPNDIIMVKVVSDKVAVSVRAYLDEGGKIETGLPITVQFSDGTSVNIKKYTGDPEMIVVLSDDQDISIVWAHVDPVQRHKCPLGK